MFKPIHDPARLKEFIIDFSVAGIIGIITGTCMYIALTVSFT